MTNKTTLREFIEANRFVIEQSLIDTGAGYQRPINYCDLRSWSASDYKIRALAVDFGADPDEKDWADMDKPNRAPELLEKLKLCIEILEEFQDGRTTDFEDDCIKSAIALVAEVEEKP